MGALGLLAAGSPRAVLRGGLRWFGREVLFGTDVFVKVAASILVMRGITWLAGQWWGSEKLWGQSEDLLKGFERGPAAPESEFASGDRPQLIHAMAGWKFYRHNTVYQGQNWACPLLIPDPCQRCEWFLRGQDSRPYCAAVAKVKVLHIDSFRDKDLYDVMDMLKAQYGSAGNGVHP